MVIWAPCQTLMERCQVVVTCQKAGIPRGINREQFNSQIDTNRQNEKHTPNMGNYISTKLVFLRASWMPALQQLAGNPGKCLTSHCALKTCFHQFTGVTFAPGSCIFLTISKNNPCRSQTIEDRFCCAASPHACRALTLMILGSCWNPILMILGSFRSQFWCTSVNLWLILVSWKQCCPDSTDPEVAGILSLLQAAYSVRTTAKHFPITRMPRSMPHRPIGPSNHTRDHQGAIQ